MPKYECLLYLTGFHAIGMQADSQSNSANYNVAIPK